MLKKIVILSLFCAFGFVSCSNNGSKLPKLCIQEIKGVGTLNIDLLEGKISSDDTGSVISGYHHNKEAYGYLWPFPISVPNQDSKVETWMVGDVGFTSTTLSKGQKITSEFSEFGFDQPPIRSIVTLDGSGMVKGIIVQEEDRKTSEPVTIFESCGRKYLSLKQLKKVSKERSDIVVSDGG